MGKVDNVVEAAFAFWELALVRFLLEVRRSVVLIAGQASSKAYMAVRMLTLKRTMALAHKLNTCLV